VADKQR